MNITADFSKTIASVIDKIIEPSLVTVLVFALASVLKFLPVSLLEVIGVLGFATIYGEWIGPVWLVSGLILLIFLIRALGRQLRRWLGIATQEIKTWLVLRQGRNDFNTLNDQQVSILNQFFVEGKDILLLSHRDDDVQGVVSRRFIYPEEKVPILSLTWYRLASWVTEATMQKLIEDRTQSLTEDGGTEE